MNAAAPFRCQPLMMLGGVIAAWMIIRALLWQSPFPVPQVVSQAADVARQLAQPVVRPEIAAAAPLSEGSPLYAGELTAPLPAARSDVLPPMWAPAPVPAFPTVANEPPVLQPADAAVPVRGAVAHNLMLFAALSVIELPPAIVAYLQAVPARNAGVPRAAPVVATAPLTAPSTARWSGDSWLLLRGDRGALAAGQPSYGRSQAGAVLRYRLAQGSAVRPEAYARGAVAIAGAREREVAAGLSARLLPGLPIRFAAEARVSDTAAGTEVHPAAFAVTEPAPLPLPFGAQAEAYVQGGYVGGRFATPFIDGQARIERTIVRQGETSLSAGGGVWGGAQKGAGRLDVGPTTNVQFRLGDARGRMAADYRFRVAGDAVPASGPALTLSAGF